ncbi:MAG: hypothetical protein JXA30_14955 [Deltaproteobacteria bacterium]|nr:hypothetical protein [Deltaproteobacteria bacterium]
MSQTDKDESDISEAASCDLESFFERAARDLTPVSVTVGQQQPRFRSFIDSIQGRGQKKRLLLSPIAARSIPTKIESRIKICPLYDDPSWELSATGIVPVDDVTLAVALKDARLFSNVQASDGVMQPANDPLILVVTAGAEEDKANIFLISEIGSMQCVIETTAPFEPGSTIPLVEIVGDKRILRRAAATVTKVEPWFMPDGSQRFRCSLILSQAAVKDFSDVFDIVKDVRRVHRIMELAGMLTAFGWYEVAGYERDAIRVLGVEQDSALLQLLSSRSPRLQTHSSVRIGVDIFAVYYEMEVRILEVKNERMRVTLPLVLKRRRQHRRAERVSVPSRYELCLKFCNPTTGRVQQRSIEEISYVGLTFCSDGRDPLWEGLVLEGAELSWKGRRIVVGDLEVCSLSKHDDTFLCHTSMNNSNAANNPTLVDLIATLSHPDIRFHDGSDFSSLVDLYIQAGLFSPHMHRNLEPIIIEAKTVWTKLHRGASDVVRTLIHGPAKSPNIAMTSLRGWERAWMAQHFVSVNPKFDRAIGRLQLAQLDHVLPRSDGHYILFFVKADNKLMNAFLQNFFFTTGTTDSVTIITVELWYRSGDKAIGSVERDRLINLRAMRRDEEQLVSRAAQRYLGILPAAALSMLPGEFALPNSSKSFSKAGLLRDRICRVATFRRRPVYAVLEERSSPGLNLTWMLNASWVLPIHPQLDRDGLVLSSVLQNILNAPAQSPLGDRFLNLPERTPKKPFIDAGFELIAPVNLYVLNRAGLQRYYYYAANRYGEMKALVQRRNQRKTEPESPPAPGASMTESDAKASRGNM